MTPRVRPLVATLLTVVAGLALASPAGAVPLLVAAPVLEPASVQVLEDTNEARAAAGCAPLLVHDALVATAIGYSTELAERGVLSHRGADGSTPRQRMLAHGVSPRIAAENLAWNYSAADVTAAWLASPGHAANILDCRLVHVGIAERHGPTGVYWTQVFSS